MTLPVDESMTTLRDVSSEMQSSRARMQSWMAQVINMAEKMDNKAQERDELLEGRDKLIKKQFAELNEIKWSEEVNSYRAAVLFFFFDIERC